MYTSNEDLIATLLEAIGDDPRRAGLAETPQRVTKAWTELFYGYNTSARPCVTVFPNGADGIVYAHTIGDTGTFFSHCEHHLLPFFGTYALSYIPDTHIIGLSKIQRIVNYHAARLQTQERLVKDVLDDLSELIAPKGIALALSGRHLCREMRGVRNIGGIMQTMDMRGVMETDHTLKHTFLSHLTTQ